MVKRSIIYTIGILVLALGIVLNTRTGLGVAAVASFAYAINQMTGLSLGTASMIIYLILVVAQIALVKKADLKILLQIPFSIIFGWILDFYNAVISIHTSSLVSSFILLFIAIFCTASGVYLAIKSNMILNPVDGVVKTISDVFKLPFGKVKISFDFSFVMMTVIVSYLYTGSIIGIGIGTVFAVLLMGNTIQFLSNNFDGHMIKLLA